MRKSFSLLLIVCSLNAIAQPYTTEVHNGIWWQKNLATGDSARVLTPSQINTNMLDSVGFGTKASAKVTISNVSCLTCPAPQNGTLLHIVSEGGVNGRISHDTYNNGGAQGSIIQGRRARGTANAPTAALQDDIGIAIGTDFYGATGFRGISLGGLSVRADANITDISAPTYLNFTTTSAGAIVATDRMRILSNGTVRINSLNSIGFVQTDGSGNLSTAAITGAQVISALGFTPVSATDSAVFQTKYRSDTARTNTYTAIASKISGNQNITLSGDLSGSGTTAITTTLATTGVIAGTYGRVTVDSKGRVTAGKRVETYSGTTNASGLYTVTYSTPFSVTPNVQLQIGLGGGNKQTVLLTASTVNGFTAYVQLRSDVLGILPSYSNVSGQAVDVLVTEK